MLLSLHSMMVIGMAISALDRTKTTDDLDEAEICAALKRTLIDMVRDDAVRKEVILPDDDHQILSVQIEIDSLSAVETLASLDTILPFEVGQCVVQAGGYNSIQSALDHMLPRIRQEWEKRKRGKK